MKRAFSLIETLFALVILGVVFAFFYASFERVAQNGSFARFNQALYNEQRALQSAPTQKIQLSTQNLGVLPFSQAFDEGSTFKLKALKPENDEFKAFFEDEKSF